MSAAFDLGPGEWVVLDSLAVFRLTRLITADQITERGRKWVRDRLGTGAFYFATCAWCTSIWLAVLVVIATVIAPTTWRYAAYVLTCSAVAGLLADRS